MDHVHNQCDCCDQPFPTENGVTCYTVCSGRLMGVEQPVAAVCGSCYDRAMRDREPQTPDYETTRIEPLKTSAHNAPTRA